MMGSEMPAIWYDKEYSEKSSSYRKPVEESGYYHLYRVVLSFLPKDKSTAIIDLGCGSGRLARLLVDAGYDNYFGVDFSPVAIELARQYVPEVEFLCSDFFDPQVLARMEEFDTFIMVEVLEHIKNDLKLLACVPTGGSVVLSVPERDYTSHVRHFVDGMEVHFRYGKLLSFDGARTVGSTFIISGTKW